MPDDEEIVGSFEEMSIGAESEVQFLTDGMSRIFVTRWQSYLPQEPGYCQTSSLGLKDWSRFNEDSVTT